ncbi:MAG: uroporphyrinogen-III C-methyltransferase [Pseudomonadales bacterium]|nr:uroporphyrinogen-III C-methyltransferase [Pseudomonadales bacterium]MBO7007277.1 uroporphyrinogen-III C-methyltransferase [Pseudomonadales bacterium]
MRYLPLHLDLKGRHVLVVGGGEIALRKVTLLLKAGARITLVAPEISGALKETLRDHELLSATYESSHLDNKVLVVAATENETVNREVSGDATAKNILVNVVDSPELCTVTFPAIIDRSPLVVSVGSAGGAPVLTRYVREQIELLLPERITQLAGFLAKTRDKLKDLLPDIDRRRRQTEDFLTTPGAEAAMSGDSVTAESYLFDTEKTVTSGEVYLVGAGPGDPDLLTLRALQLMQKAEVVLYDNLVSPRVLDRVRRDAEMEFVGKRSGYKSTSQEDINDLLVRLAKDGKRVLRLKGGDPFIFGRGGEEIQKLIEGNIPFQVVPGITAASGCAAYAGIPLTHRELSQSVRFVTGHPKDGKVDLPWQEFVHPMETVVFYMGLGGLATICQQLMNAGREASTPVAIVSKGTTPEQQVLKGTLESMPGLVARTQIQTPTLIIVGDVVNFSAQI